jgi:FkbM family methyltransferase
MESIWSDEAIVEQPPVLVDVGASGNSPQLWSSIAKYAVFIGFDPDLRAVREVTEGRFHREIMINEAVVADEAAAKIKLFLTQSPYCSSTLRPDAVSLANYFFADLFKVVGEVEVSATTLNKIVRRFQLFGIDWLKLDTQGIDLRLFQSLEPATRLGVLALDIEPGLIDAYEGEDLFSDAHSYLVKSGFWLAHMDVKETVRIRQTTLDWICAGQSPQDVKNIVDVLDKSPGWTEATYLRTIESLRQRNAGRRDYLLLWLFALMLERFGFAFDVAAAFGQNFKDDCLSPVLKAEAFEQFRAAKLSKSSHRQSSHRGLRAVLKSFKFRRHSPS